MEETCLRMPRDTDSVSYLPRLIFPLVKSYWFDLMCALLNTKRRAQDTSSRSNLHFRQGFHTLKSAQEYLRCAFSSWNTCFQYSCGSCTIHSMLFSVYCRLGTFNIGIQMWCALQASFLHVEYCKLCLVLQILESQILCNAFLPNFSLKCKWDVIACYIL